MAVFYDANRHAGNFQHPHGMVYVAIEILRRRGLRLHRDRAGQTRLREHNPCHTPRNSPIETLDHAAPSEVGKLRRQH